jgi:hypothetical protein
MALRKEGDPVPSVDERVAYLEGRVEDHYGAMAEIRTDLREMRTEMRTDMHALRVEVRDEIRELRGDMSSRFHALDTKINWVIGSLLAMALAVVGALLKR